MDAVWVGPTCLGFWNTFFRQCNVKKYLDSPLLSYEISKWERVWSVLTYRHDDYITGLLSELQCNYARLQPAMRIYQENDLECPGVNSGNTFETSRRRRLSKRFNVMSVRSNFGLGVQDG